MTDKIQHEYYTNIEGDNNRGWRIDKISATHVNREVGYLKLSYIPSALFDQYYPTIFNWMDQIRGQLIMPRPTGLVIHDNGEYREASCRHYETFTATEAYYFLERLGLRHGREEHPHEDDRDALLQEIRDRETVLLSGTYGKEFREFEEYYVDKPIDDFIRVHDDYRRQGIAEELYDLGVEWLAKQGLSMYLSTLRAPSARALSDKMRDAGKLDTIVNGRERFITRNTSV